MRCFRTDPRVGAREASGPRDSELANKNGTPLWVRAAERWPRIRKYWRRVRRRICSACGKYTLDLSQPRYLVCGGCGKGRGVGRYCSEACQAEHWPLHWMDCASSSETRRLAVENAELRRSSAELQQRLAASTKGGAGA